MTLNVFEASAFVGLKSFVAITGDQKYKPHAFLPEVKSTGSEPKKFQKKFAIHMPMEQRIAKTCTENNIPKILWPIANQFSLNIKNYLLNGNCNGTGIVRDVVDWNTASETYAVFVMGQLDYLEKSSYPFNRYITQMHMATKDNIRRHLDCVRNIFSNTSSNITQGEVACLADAGAEVDIVKNIFPDNLMPPSTQQGRSGWLFLPGE